jgi:L-lactate dehydrogenase complex protein LldE
MVKVLRKLGFEVLYNENQTCCGQPAFNSGQWKEASVVATKWLGDMKKFEEQIVCPSSSCVGFVKNYLGDMFTDSNDCQVVKEKTFEFCEFIAQYSNFEKLSISFPSKAVYHDSCAALRECKIFEAPRKLLSIVQGLELLDLPDSNQCCGFGGTFSIKFEPISVALSEKKVQNTLSVGAEYIISADLSCLLQLDAYIQKNKIPLKVLHIADLLAMGV